jgi:hypothetical protein
VAVRAVAGSHEMVPDRERERQRAAGLDFVLVAADRAEQQPQVVHAPVVDAPQPFGDGRVVPRPGADGEVDWQQLAGEGERAGQLYPRPGVAAMPFGAFDHRVGAHPLPGVEHLGEQRVPAGEMPVEPALGDTERLREHLDAHGVWPAGGQGPQALFDPPAAGRSCDGCHSMYTVPYIWLTQGGISWRRVSSRRS